MSEEGVIWLRAIFSCVMPLWGRYFFMNDRRDGEAYPYGRFAMWYVLQTTTGQEEKLVQMIQELVAPELYEDCFVAYYERPKHHRHPAGDPAQDPACVIAGGADGPMLQDKGVVML